MSNQLQMPFEPKGYKFYDKASKREMMMIEEGQWKGWLAYKHPDGQWVTLRKASPNDLFALASAVSKQFHSL